MYVTKVNLEITSELVWMVFIGSYYMEQQSKKKIGDDVPWWWWF